MKDRALYKNIDLSEQQIVDCTVKSYGNAGCRGGDMHYVYDYLKTSMI